jgi:hypothetical protein
VFDEIEIESGSNGSGKGLLKKGALEQLLKNNELPSIAKELVHPGADPQELLMRTIFKSDKELNAAVNYLSKCKEFADREGEQVLLMKLAGKTSIGGLSRDQLVQVLVGQLHKTPPVMAGQKKEKQKDEL